MQLLDLELDCYLGAASAANDGMRDFGGEEFREPLAILLRSVKDEAQLTPQGLAFWQHRTLQLLGNRLQVARLIHENPEILDEPIERPLIIVSPQRTGSTKLQNLLACDERWHTPRLWEALFPTPFPGEARGDPTPRIAAAQAWHDAFYGMIPEALAAHAMFPEEPEEETFAVEMSFRWTVASVSAFIPSYIRWVETHDCRPTYRDMKRILQVLQWQRGSRKPWLLKSPWHIGFLDALLEIFPDATLVQGHRDPYESVASNAALMYLGRSVGRPDLDKHLHGADVLAMNAREMASHLEQREALGDKDPTIDVHYKAIVNDPIGVADQIYRARGETLTPDAEQAIREWDRANVQHKHGRFDYRAEDFGLTREAVRAAFAPYYAREREFLAS